MDPQSTAATSRAAASADTFDGEPLPPPRARSPSPPTLCHVPTDSSTTHSTYASSARAYWPPRSVPLEDASTFGSRLHFVRLSISENETIPWPCLVFDNTQQLISVLQSRDWLDMNIDETRLRHRINLEYMQHAFQTAAATNDAANEKMPQQSEEETCVAFMFGSRTPGGRRLAFSPSSLTANQNEHDSLQLHDYQGFVAQAIEEAQHAPPFWEALQETSPILADWLSHEMVSNPHRQLGPEEHAPAA